MCVSPVSVAFRDIVLLCTYITEAGMEPDQIPKDIPIPPGAVGLDVVIPNLEEQHRLEPPGGAKPKRPRYGLPIPRTPGPRRQLSGAGAQPVGSGDDRFAFEMPSPTYSGPDRQLPCTGTQPVKTGNDRFIFGMSSPTYPGPGSSDRVPGHSQ